MVEVEPRVDERRLLPAEPGGGGVVVGDGVDGPFDPPEAAEGDLVAHGVGEALGGPRAVDLVPVVVDPGVQRPQGERAVLAQDGAGEVAQGSAGDAAGVGLCRWDRGLVGRRWSAALVLRVHRPQELAAVVEVVEGVEALAGEPVDLGVDLGEPCEVLVAGDLELETAVGGQPGPAAVVEEPASGRCRLWAMVVGG
ncbi:MAG: hypothetical protein KF703_10360 [Actinobacteria bacterium]|nr:hypothetical protein [Actinomycetota bacterium]